MKLRGNNLIVFFDVGGVWKTLAYATTCEIDINAQTIETSSPDTGKWVTRKKRKRDWQLSSGHLLFATEQEVDFFDLLESDQTIKLCFATVEKHPGIIDCDNYKKDGRFELVGDAYVTRLTITGRKGDMITSSATFQGNGKLEQKWAPWVFVDGKWDASGVWRKDGVWE